MMKNKVEQSLLSVESCRKGWLLRFGRLIADEFGTPAITVYKPFIVQECYRSRIAIRSFPERSEERICRIPVSHAPFCNESVFDIQLDLIYRNIKIGQYIPNDY